MEKGSLNNAHNFNQVGKNPISEPLLQDPAAGPGEEAP